MLERLQIQRPRALLVAPSDRKPFLDRVRAVLVERCELRDDDVLVLVDACRKDIVEVFRQIAGRGAGTVFFLFVGPGAEGAEEGDVRLATADAADLSLSALASEAPLSVGLTAAIFITSRWQRGLGPSEQGLSNRWRTVLLDVWRPRLPGLPEHVPDVDEQASLLEQLARPSFTAADWLRGAERQGAMRGRGDPACLLFASPDLERAASLVATIERAPLHQALDLLAKLTRRHDLAAQAWLHCGVVRAALGQLEEALEDVERAIDVFRTEEVACKDPSGRVRWPEAHYHHGRILLALERYSDAEGALAVAVAQDQDHARAHYHRARAIRRLIELDLRKSAREAATHYEALGAPLGPDEEIARLAHPRTGGKTPRPLH